MVWLIRTVYCTAILTLHEIGACGVSNSGIHRGVTKFHTHIRSANEVSLFFRYYTLYCEMEQFNYTRFFNTLIQALIEYTLSVVCLGLRECQSLHACRHIHIPSQRLS
jgi:hypothetical protein